MQLEIKLLFLCALIWTSFSACPNDCNGHGVCSVESECLCDDDYKLVADCSLLRCPHDYAWVDKAYGNTTANLAHRSMECSGRGHCDRVLGACECFDGFEGEACQRSISYCGPNGFPMTMSDIYTIYSTEMYYSTLQIITDSDNNMTYQGWEKDRIQHCVCDRGFFGPQCDMRMCPKGDDPLTGFSDYYSLNINLRATSGFLGGFVHLIFNGEIIVFPSDHREWSLSDCKAIFESLMGVEEVRCMRPGSADAYGSVETVVSFRHFSTYPYETNIYTHNGHTLASKMICKTDYITGTSDTATCILTDVTTAMVPEYEFCSNRGTCNFDTGICDCYANFTNRYNIPSPGSYWSSLF